jgi:hypothetical protein
MAFKIGVGGLFNPHIMEKVTLSIDKHAETIRSNKISSEGSEFKNTLDI